MLTEYQKFRMLDERGEKEFYIEVNWENKKETNECKVLKVTFPNGDVSYLKRKLLNELLFVIGNAADKRSLIPFSIKPVHWHETVLGVKATKNIAKGEMINFPIKISIPCDQVKEIIGIDNYNKELGKVKEKTHSLITP